MTNRKLNFNQITMLQYYLKINYKYLIYLLLRCFQNSNFYPSKNVNFLVLL